MDLETVTPTMDLAAPEAGKAALRVFFRIAEAWGLNSLEQMTLLGIDEREFFEWKDGNPPNTVDRGTLERLSHVFGIYSALHVLLPIPERANSWIRRPNSAPQFAGRTALARMLGGQLSDLVVVREYLDVQRFS